jgi:hypothetical protein
MLNVREYPGCQEYHEFRDGFAMKRPKIH